MFYVDTILRGDFLFQHPYSLSMCSYIGPRLDFFKSAEIHKNYVIIGMESGSFEFSVGKINGHAAFGDLVFIPPGVMFKRKSLEEITFHMLCFVPNFEPDPIFDPLPVGKVTISSVNRLSSTYSFLRQSWREYGSKSKDTSFAMHLLMDLLHLSQLERYKAKSRSSRTDHRIRQAAGYIHAQLFGDLSMKAIASYLGIKPSELTRRFRLEYGVTPIEYATSLRLEEVKKLLLETDSTLDTIAAQCGYENGSYLGRVFRSKLGINPSEFRKINQI
jgi:AraC-like DNA-binding protein